MPLPVQCSLIKHSYIFGVNYFRPAELEWQQLGWSYIIFYAPRTTYILIVTSGSRTRGQIPCSVIRINRISGKSSCRLVAPGGPIIMILSSSLFRRHWEWPRGCITLFIGWLDGRMGGSVLLGTACYLSLRDSRAAGIGEFQQTETMPPVSSPVCGIYLGANWRPKTIRAFAAATVACVCAHDNIIISWDS